MNIADAARREGFSAVFILPPVALARTEVFDRNRHVADDPLTLLPSARCVLLLIYPYRPYQMPEGWREAEISAYYPASNRAYHACARVAARLAEEGWQTVANAQLPLKRLLYAFGGAELGRNGLADLPGAGTRFVISAIVTDMPPDDARAFYARPYALSPACANCGACVKACPTGALNGAGHVDIDRCLRAQPEAGPVKTAYRALIGNRILGCDICQNVCPRNARIERAPLDAETAACLTLTRLLSGDIENLSGIIGPNYARKGRVAAMALIAAANLNRRDLTDKVEALTASPLPGVRAHAKWALEIMKNWREDGK